MKISNELLAAYVEGNVSIEERNQVRQYLSENPAELESVMMMMDEDYELDPYADEYYSYRNFNVDSMAHVDECSFSDIALSAAAFAPACSIENNVMKDSINIETPGHTDNRSFSNELGNLLDEIEL
ncbi:MAG: hypothetical protein NC344_06460 [Bacteroidales bacterium]|nr:hypothetical protein [Bacteroidales bacterium]MCM1147461.1 hypothetical protein [Bacteroidales bacterium]MCM1206130.1 hypothetical protein [Bacillota bacterium]MCM1510039.1 hypothetical protein [Clostridium sp.]